MSLTATYSHPVPRPSFETWALLGIIWAATILSYLVATLGAGPGYSTDDAMRLAQIRDLLAGQSWFDTTQYRLSPPDGVPMHWSRLIDLPIAALVRIGEAFALPTPRAEQVAAFVWPAGLLLAFFAGVARLARELAGDASARLALIFAALMAMVLQHFRPYALDHHNAQLVLLLWALVLSFAQTKRGSAAAGLCCALSLEIGEELAPAIAAIAAVVGVRWIVQGEAVRETTVAFALVFAATTIALFMATVAPSAYAAASCDALSIVHVTGAAIGGGGLALLAATRTLDTIGRRLAGAAALGAAAATIVAFAFPECLGDPYMHVDPRLATLWLDHVSEARSILGLMHDLPQEVLPYYGLIFVAVVLGLVRCLRERGDARWAWIACVATLAPLTLMALWQVRSAAAANAIAAALVPAALLRVYAVPPERGLFFGLGRAALIAAFLLNPLSLIGIGSAGARLLDATGAPQRPVVIADGPGTCRRAADYTPLAGLPRGLVAAFIDAGPYLLLETPHDTLAAPYHRNIKGNAAMFDIFLSRPGDAAKLLSALGVAYVAFCPGSPERYTYAAVAPDGLAAVLGRRDVPAFLERIPLAGSDLEIYRVR